MKNININELANLLMGLPKNTPCELTTLTEVKMKKTNNPLFDRVTKQAVANVLVNFCYEDEVNRELAKEGKEFNFESAERKWGANLGDTGLVTHNGGLYLPARFLNVKESKYFVDGDTEIPKVEVEPFLPAKKEGSGRQGTVEEVVVRSYKIASVKQLVIKGETYVVTQ
jgi:hypothetical protein